MFIAIKCFVVLQYFSCDVKRTYVVYPWRPPCCFLQHAAAVRARARVYQSLAYSPLCLGV